MMKKVFLISLLCCLLFGLAACNTLPRDDTTTTSSDGDTTTTSPDDDVVVEYAPVKVLKSLEEYRQYLETAELPEGFITYEQLTWIGNHFDTMAYRTKDAADYPFHSYSIISTMNERQFGYMIGCYYNGEFPLEYQNCTTYSSEDMPKDLRTISIEEADSTCFVRLIYNDKLQYVYDCGEIISIILEIDGVRITLESGDYLPLQYGDPIFDQFLDRDTAAEAYENFAAHIRGSVAGE